MSPVRRIILAEYTDGYEASLNSVSDPGYVRDAHLPASVYDLQAENNGKFAGTGAGPGCNRQVGVTHITELRIKLYITWVICIFGQCIILIFLVV